MLNTILIIVAIIVILAITAIAVIPIIKNKDDKDFNSIKIYDENGIVHEGASPLNGIHIYEKQKPYDLVSIVPEFGVDIKYFPNEKPNLRRFNIGIRSMYKLDPVVITPNGVSDGFHTFDELYCYRMLYNSNAVNLLAYIKKFNIKGFDDFDVIKSKRHFGGELCYGGGWFIVVIKTPWGQISNHYKLEHWDMFNCRTATQSWKWDGHGMKESTERMIKLNKYLANNCKF